MRISDWSSDVCSSDLLNHSPQRGGRFLLRPSRQMARCAFKEITMPATNVNTASAAELDAVPGLNGHGPEIVRYREERGGFSDLRQLEERSEEHTSELQSLMRISYAVFCLKKKKTNQLNDNEQVQRN